MKPEPRSLTIGDMAALDLLRKDRDEHGEGVTRAQLEVEGLTRHVDSLLARLRACGYVIGEQRGLHQLGHHEPASEAA